MAPQRQAPTPEPLALQLAGDGDQIRPAQQIVAVSLHDLIPGAVSSGTKGVRQRRSVEMPAAPVHGTADIDHIVVRRVVAVTLEVDDRCLQVAAPTAMVSSTSR
jgi:hypothetical protein